MRISDWSSDVCSSDLAAKICNNMLLGASMVATAEAFTLAIKLGLDPQTFFDISSKASGQNWSMTRYCPVPGPVPAAPSNRDYEGGFATALMLKDLDRKSTRLNSSPNAHLVCRLLLETKKQTHTHKQLD